MDAATVEDGGRPPDAAPDAARSDSGDPCDRDGDGYSACAGDDCDDDDPDRFAGNPEVCDGEHDEDCDATTFGTADADGDGFVSAACCNRGNDDVLRCGPDCDDSDRDVGPDAREMCNGIDDDCDGSTDEAPAVEGCVVPNATPACVAGACVIEGCDAGWDDCDGSPDTGCEANLGTSLSHCGACGTACELANATSVCSAGTCTIATCNTGFDDCDGAGPNGCETALDTLASCGSCGAACDLPNAAESCGSGSCEITSCTGLFGDCDASHATGCERPTDTLTDCGGCGVTCSRNNAAATCAGGTCMVGMCNTGFGNCDAVDANGCEQSLTTTAHCGSCGSACTVANGSGSCTVSRTCTIGSCSSGFCDEDGRYNTGCERNLRVPMTCGAGIPIGIRVDGDSGTDGSDDVVESGVGEAWFRAIINETDFDNSGDPACTDLGARFRIANTGGAGGALYTMTLYCSGCSGASTSPLSSLSPPAVVVRPDPPGCVTASFGGTDPNDSLTLYVHIELVASTSIPCVGWAVTAEPDIRTSPVLTCP